MVAVDREAEEARGDIGRRVAEPGTEGVERYDEDTSPESPNQALKSSWPSSCMFCRIIREAGKRLGEDAASYVGQIPDADLRLFARIELAAALAGLPELRRRQRVFRPSPVSGRA